MDEVYEQIKGYTSKRLIGMRDKLRKVESATHDELEKLKAINKELRLRTKRRFGKAI